LVLVCGFWTIEKDEIALSFGEPLGTTMVTVEYSNGEDVQIPEDWLEDID